MESYQINKKLKNKIITRKKGMKENTYLLISAKQIQEGYTRNKRDWLLVGGGVEKGCKEGRMGMGR